MDIERRFAARRLDPAVCAVWLELPRVGGIPEIGRDDLVSDLRCPTPILDREDHLDPPIKIAFHQVRAAQADFILAAVSEIVDTAVLEEAADHTDHADVVAPTGNAGSQTARAAHDEIDLHPSTRRAIERTH